MTPVEWAQRSALILGVVVAVLMVSLFAYKVARNRRSSFAEVRRAAYVAAMGELAYRGGYPQELLQEWVKDKVFREVVIEYLKFLDGQHRTRVLQFAHEIGMSDYLHADLSSLRTGKRSAAAEGLAQLGHTESIPFLLTSLEDRSQPVRINAAHALARVGDIETLPAVLAAMTNSSDWVRNRVADSLIKFGSQAVLPITHIIDDPAESPITKRLLVQVLGQIGDPTAEPVLLAGLLSGDIDLRVRSVAALATAGSPQCVPRLLNSLQDPDWRVRAQVANALAIRMDPAAIPLLKDSLGDEGWWVRQNAASALLKIPGGEKALLAALDDKDQFARDVAREHLMGSQLPTPNTPEGIEHEIRKIEAAEQKAEADLPPPKTRPKSAQHTAQHSAPKTKTPTGRHRAPRPRDRNKGRHRP